MQLHQYYISAIVTPLNQFIVQNFKYGISFWGSQSNGENIFILQKKIVRITFGAQPKTPRTSPFNKLKDCACTMPTYMYSKLLNFTVNNQDNFQRNSSLHGNNTRNKHHLDGPNAMFHIFCKVHSMLPSKFLVTTCTHKF